MDVWGGNTVVGMKVMSEFVVREADGRCRLNTVDHNAITQIPPCSNAPAVLIVAEGMVIR